MSSTSGAARTGPAPRSRRRSTAVLGALALLLAGLIGLTGTVGKARADASDYTQSVSQLSTAQAQITFTPTTAAAYVDTHYLVDGANQQNVRMTDTSGTWTWTVGSLTNGSVLEYWFTYEKNGPQYDTPHFTYTQGGGGTTPPGTVATPAFSPAGGTFAAAVTVTLSDATSGAVIHYTRDGSTPTASSATYSSALSIASTATVKAVAVKSGSTDSSVASATYTIGGGSSGCPAQSNTPDFGSNVHVFDPGMSSASIQSQLDAQFNQMKDTSSAQFSENRVADLFKPGSYSVEDNVGFYTSVAGLGQNPDDVTINGDVTVDAFNASDAGNATQNFWRSAENLAINPSSGTDRWAVAQAAPFRRIDVRGNLALYPASYGYASGGFIADTKVSGQASSVSQQQWYTRDSSLGSWAGGVWNMVFSGVSGAPGNTFPNPPETTLGTTPVSRDVPYLYIDSSGNYRVFLPSLRTNSSGPSWAGGSTPGTSEPMSQFYVVKAGDTASTINAALARGLQSVRDAGGVPPQSDAERDQSEHHDPGCGVSDVRAGRRGERDAGRRCRRGPDQGAAVRCGDDQLAGAADGGSVGVVGGSQCESDDDPGRVLPDRR